MYRNIRGAGLVHPQEKKALRGSHSSLQTPTRTLVRWQTPAFLSGMGQEDKTQLEQEGVRWDISTKIFPRRTAKQQDRLPSEGVQPPHLEIFNIQLDKSLSDLVIAEPVVSRDLDWRPPEVPCDLYYPAILAVLLVMPLTLRARFSFSFLSGAPRGSWKHAYVPNFKKKASTTAFFWQGCKDE